MRKSIVVWIVAALVMGALGCQGGDEDPQPFLGGGGPPAGTNNDAPNNDVNNDVNNDAPNNDVSGPTQGDLRGYISNDQGTALLNVQIRIEGAEGYDETTVSYEGGHFELLDVPFGDLKVTIAADQHVTLRRTLTHAETSTSHFFDFVLKRAAPVLVFDSEDGLARASAGEARITLPAGGYVSKETGEAVSGQVNVVTAYYDPRLPGDMRAAPPLYRVSADLPQGLDGNRLVSFGMIDVELYIDGELVDLGPGKTATLELPIPSDLASQLSGSESVPAWYYDTTNEEWVLEGSGDLERDNDNNLKWIAEVSHFTTWNADYVDRDSCDDVANLRSCGSNVGACRPGQYRCLLAGGRLTLFDGRGGQEALCDGAVGPGAETCNGIDDNCNGATDETFPTKGDACYTGPEGTEGVGACHAGQRGCNGGGARLEGMITCDNQVIPGEEQCNGIDEDCDGVADNDEADICGTDADCQETDEGWQCVPRT